MPEALRIGLVGCGRLAEAGYAPAAAATDSVRIAALADPDPERLASVAAACQGSPVPHRDAGELLAAGGVDALVIAAPPEHHEAAARAAAHAGVPALVEKPPAPDAEGAERIAALDPPPWIGFNRRFSLGSGVAGALPPNGSIELELRYRRFAWAPVTVRDPALIDLGPHLIDLALLAGMGAPVRVRARSRRPEHIEIEVEGTTGTARIRCACDRPHRERVLIRDAAGGRVLERRIGGLVRGAVARLRTGPHPLVASLTAQLEALAAVVRGTEPAGEDRLATAAEGFAVMRVVSACAASLAHAGEAVEPSWGAGVP